MTIKIDNPEIEEFDVKTLDPKKNSYRLNYNIDEVDESSNPFKDIKDVTSYAKELRDKAWR